MCSPQSSPSKRCLGQNHRELLAAVTRGDVTPLDVVLQGQRDEPQDLIPDQMAESVIEAFEVIDVAEEQRERFGLPSASPLRAPTEASKCLRLASVVRIGQIFRAHSFEMAVEVLNFLLGAFQPSLKRTVADPPFRAPY